jgi:SAM-dependent methyltransferase
VSAPGKDCGRAVRPTPLVSLAGSGLGVGEDELARLFAPFVLEVAGGSDQAWSREVARRKRKLAKATARRLALGWLPKMQRREATVLKEYNKAWQGIDYGTYSLDAPRTGHTPWQWRERRMLASDVGATRFRQLLLIRVIERVRPERMLEVGCGNGINLVLLACRFPEVAFTGLELTETGHQAAVRFQERHAALPEAMQAYAPLALRDPGAFGRIRFVQGNAADLPFADRSFDLTYTVLALEQMERLRERALLEIARVSGGHTLMIEPFRDVNGALWPRLNIARRDYFRGAIGDLPSYGLEPVLALDDFPQECFLKACAVLSHVEAGEGRVARAA